MGNYLYKLNKKIYEDSTTGGGVGAGSFSPGSGAQYATPFAFNPNKKANGTSRNYYYKLGFKKVPKKIKGSGVEVKQLKEEESPVKIFQEKRIKAFDEIEQELNNIYQMLSNAKKDTIQYYNDKKSSFSVIYPTDIILDYLKDINKILIKDNR